jgi:hypothetical protein
MKQIIPRIRNKSFMGAMAKIADPSKGAKIYANG